MGSMIKRSLFLLFVLGIFLPNLNAFKITVCLSKYADDSATTLFCDSFDVESSDTFLDLRKKINGKNSRNKPSTLSGHDAGFFFQSGDEWIEDESKTLGDYGIKDGGGLTLYSLKAKEEKKSKEKGKKEEKGMVRKEVREEKEHHVKIQLIMNHDIEVKLSDSVRDFKKKNLGSTESIDQFGVRFEGKWLEDEDKQLGDYGVKAGSVVYLEKKEKGRFERFKNWLGSKFDFSSNNISKEDE